MTRPDPVLVPRPQQLRRTTDSLRLPSPLPIRWAPNVPGAQAAANRLAERVAPLVNGSPPTAAAGSDDHGPAVFLGPAVDTGPLAPDGYRLSIRGDGIRIRAGGPAGFFYGAMTLVQVIRSEGTVLPGLEIEDAPDFPVRGVMLDVSRDKVPTLDTLYAWVDWLSELKVNQLQLYTEHTFAYLKHPEVWADASPLTAAEIRSLDLYCADRFVELVPNQNSFGHLRRWLLHPRYRHLAECEGAFPYPWGGTGQGPFSLNPLHPGSVRLLEDWYQELLPNFQSGRFNVGCDETFDLGVGASRAACEQRGKGRVYLDFLLKIHALCRRHHRTMMFWGDILLKHPALVPDLPTDVVALNWGYEAVHPFDRECPVFAEAGLPFWVCPGTSSWLSLVGRTRNCLSNLGAAVDQGKRWGATGVLVTDWGDEGHWQPQVAADVGLAAGAAYAWSRESNRRMDPAPALSVHRYRDEARVLGTVALEAGDVHRVFHLQPANRSMLHQGLVLSPPELRELAVTPGETGQAMDLLDELMSRLARARPMADDGHRAREEWAHALRLARHGCRRMEAVRTGRDHASLGKELEDLVAEQKRLWLRRNRPGGLADSLSKFDRVRAAYTENRDPG